MTDTVKGFTVSLEKDIRIDDVEWIINAIKMIKGVAEVTPSIVSHEDRMNRDQLRAELRGKFIEFWKENL